MSERYPESSILREWHKPPIVPEDEKIVSDWRPVGDEWEVIHKVPTVTTGFGRVVEYDYLPVRRQIERRAVWKFVGYEERTVDS